MIRASYLVALATPICLLMAAASRSAETPAETKKVDQPESLRKSIAEAISLLDDKKIGEFMERFVPGVTRVLKESAGWDEFKTNGYDRYLKDWVEPLKQIESQQVRLSPDGHDATFDLRAPVRGIGTKLGFEKLGDRWVMYRRERDLKAGEKRVEQPPALRHSVKKCVDALASNHWDELVKMIAPDEQAHIRKGEAPPKERIDAALKVLKEIQTSSRKVILSADGDKATFELSAESPKPTMTFKKVDGTWYISDKN